MRPSVFSLIALLAGGLSVFGRPPSRRRATGGSPLPDLTSILDGVPFTLDPTFTPTSPLLEAYLISPAMDSNTITPNSPLPETYFTSPATDSDTITPTFFTASVIPGTSLLPAVKPEDSNDEETASAFSSGQGSFGSFDQFPKDGVLTNLETAPKYSQVDLGPEVGPFPPAIDRFTPNNILKSFDKIRSGACSNGMYTLSTDLNQFLFHCGTGLGWGDVKKSLKEFKDKRVAGTVVVPIYADKTIKIAIIHYNLYEKNEKRRMALMSGANHSLEWALRTVFKEETFGFCDISLTENLRMIDHLAATYSILTQRYWFDQYFPGDKDSGSRMYLQEKPPDICDGVDQRVAA
ncbi:hypothetical protein MMC22_007593 [Lobaria immixta]|nr:hypothetical protein [Lobaria immixta]